MRGIRSNPFVVLADITIALCFIFAVYAVLAAGRKVFSESTRDQRQMTLEKKLRDVISHWYEGNGSQLVMESQGLSAEDQDLGLRSVLTVGKNGNKIAFYGNSSFQRVSFYDPFFQVGGKDLADPTVVDLYRQLGEVLRLNRNDFQYVYLQGFAESDEIGSYSQSERRRFLARLSRSALEREAKSYDLPFGSDRRSVLVEAILATERLEWLRKLSVERASLVYRVWESSGVVAKPSEALGTRLDPRFVIPYGTGSKLYQRPEMGVGRVDIVLFFGDLTDEQRARSRPVR